MKRNKSSTNANAEINNKRKHESEGSLNTKKRRYTDDHPNVETVQPMKLLIPTVTEFSEQTLNFHGSAGKNHKGSLPRVPMDCSASLQLTRQESALSFSELVSPSSADTIRFERRAEATCLESDGETSYSGTPKSGFYLKTSQQSVNSQQNTCKKLNMYLQKKYEYFKDEIDPEELADILLSKEIIKQRERELIQEERFRAAKTDRLIKALVRNSRKISETNDHIFVQVVIDSFGEAKYGYLFDNFKDFKEQNLEEGLPIDNLWMGKLSYFASQKGEELDALALIDQLLAKEVITFDEHQNILDIPSKQDKIETLVKFIKEKTFRHYSSFCEIIKEEYPDLSLMFSDGIYERMEIPLELEQISTVKVNVQKIPLEGQDLFAETVVKMTIEGDSDSGNEMEHMIVDANSPKPQEGLEAMVMGDIHCEMQVSFSCIKITLGCLSERSLMLLMQKSKESPTFLEGWIKELFDVKKMKMLLDRGHHKINFTIQINWPEFVMTRRDIAHNYEYMKRELEPKDYGKILTGVKGGEDVIKIISSNASRDARCREFIVYMVTNDEAPVEKLSTMLKGSEILKVIKKKRQNPNRHCTCRLTKKSIVENFTLLEKKVQKIDDIIRIFADFPGFDDEAKSKFKAITTKEGFKTETLLRAILAMPDDELQVCLFEDSLKETNQEDLLKEIINKGENKEDSMTITKEDINRNISFLQQELEPMRFISMLPKQDDKTTLRDEILEEKSRRQRCKLFLDYLKESDEATLKKFTLELRRLHMDNIIDCLLSARHQGLAENCLTKEDICGNMSFLEDMLDPMELRYILIGNENDKSRIALDKVLSAPKKRRCKVFLDIMLNAEEHVFKRFTTYLEKQMPVVHKFLVNARGDKDRIKRLVVESLLDSYNCIVEEIEPSSLKHIFIERQVITNEDFQLILSNPSRRSRAIALMANVLKGPASMAQCMMDALESAGYKSLIRRINETNDKFRECPKLYRLKLGGDECFAFEGTMKIMFDQTTSNTDIDDVSVPLSRKKVEQIQQWLYNIEGVTFENLMEPGTSSPQMSVNNGTGPEKDVKQTNEKLGQREDRCSEDMLNSLNSTIDWFDCSYSYSSPGSSQFRRVDDETADKSYISVGRSNSVSTINEDSNTGESVDSPPAVVPNLDRVRHDLASISCEYIKGVEQGYSDFFYENSMKSHTAFSPIIESGIEMKCMTEKAKTEVIPNICRCNLGNENSQNAQFDARMGKCEQHGLYYIK